ncbi:hypothetical protein [Microvirga yunnanensis]|uniref:hypothetical protein n=1 Tax=Microvirga yunnanensis TaxID=2953740 RepID=UPI0021C93C01|nr:MULTISPECIES: hypothetical protein [unclassified Microvirga]
MLLQLNLLMLIGILPMGHPSEATSNEELELWSAPTITQIVNRLRTETQVRTAATTSH